MKMEWHGDYLLVNGVILAEAAPNVEYHDGKDDVVDGFYWRCGDDAGRTDTLEAAKQAVEQAVMEWFREALGEPVAWTMRDQKGELWGLWLDGERAATAKAASETVLPLYALPSKEPSDE